MGHKSIDPEGGVGGTSYLPRRGQTLTVLETLLRTRSQPQEEDLGPMAHSTVSETILVEPSNTSQA